ncbi:YHYH domain-containing protein [Serratia sp. DD3]|nr:YHYH domain-containing protein [Serratia sp. DD3]KEY58482.1 hypothetical protein SRDD_27290 [Serratia sp. DD3]
MKKVFMMLLVGLSMFMSISTQVFAHSGGTNSDGCHENRKTGDYHCHNNK